MDIMQTQRREGNFIFKPDIGLGNVKFSMKESDVIRILGEPNLKKKDNELGYSNFIYENLINHISIYFQYEDGYFDYMSIHLNRLLVDGKDISVMKRSELQSYLRKYHKKLELKYNCLYEEDELDDFYTFENIGLTVWFEGNKVSDICINPVFNDEE